MKDRCHPLSGRGTSVLKDWRAWLPEVKDRFFRDQIQYLESHYNMFSVSLDEALGFRQVGRLAHAHQALAIASALCGQLKHPIAGLLCALSEHAKHYGTIPNTAPLDPLNYQGPRSQRLAWMSGMLNRVLFSQRLQFLHKTATLLEMVEDLAKDFRLAADELVEGTSVDPAGMWEQLDVTHYDINTCLREAIVLLKSFLIALPEGQLAAFAETVRQQCQPGQSGSPVPQHVIRHRRMAAIAGE